MYVKKKALLVLNILIVFSFLFVGCSNKYTVPENELDRAVLKEVRTVLKNVEGHLKEENRERIQSIELRLDRTEFAVSTSNLKKILLPAQGNLTTFAQNDQESYLNLMCSDDTDCQVKFVKYCSVYYSLHKLYHVVNKEKYSVKESDAVIKKPKGLSTKMSFDEEIRAESVLVKYLSMYEPDLLEELTLLFRKILEEKGVDLDPDKMKNNWNTFQLKNFQQVNNAKMFVFVHASQQMDDSSLEELLFENNN